MRIEILYFDGCPHYEQARRLVGEVIREEHLKAGVKMIPVGTDREAQTLRFIGSPTIRIAGCDVDPERQEAGGFRRQCRVYAINGKLAGLPSKEMIRSTLHQILEGKDVS